MVYVFALHVVFCGGFHFRRVLHIFRVLQVRRVLRILRICRVHHDLCVFDVGIDLGFKKKFNASVSGGI